MRIDEIIKTTDMPRTVSSLAQDLSRLGVCKGDILLTHTSLSAFGWVCGSAVGMVMALEQALNTEGKGRSRGTLVMPSQTSDLSSPILWNNPRVPDTWWQTIMSEMPEFDPRWTPTYGMGKITESLRTQPGTLRSAHPQHSFIARGRFARRVIRHHEIPYSLGEKSPLSRLYDLDARILLAGVGWDSCTALHLSEHRCNWVWKTQLTEYAPVRKGKERVWLPIPGWNITNEDFLECGKAFEAAHPENVVRGTVGSASCIIVPMRSVVDFGRLWIPKHRNNPLMIGTRF